MITILKAESMKQFTWKWMMVVVLVTVLTGCTSPSTSAEMLATETATTAPTSTSTPISTPTSINAPPPFSDGPLLLVQTGFDAYHIIDISQETAFPFVFPIEIGSLNLRQNLSPSGRLLIFPTADQMIGIMDFTTWEIANLDYVYGDSPAFDPQRAADEALETLSQLGYTREDLLTGLDEAATQSKQILQWYQNDHTLLTVQAGSPTNTYLFLYDMESEENIQLEDQPGLVQAIWAAPGGDKILVKKGFIFDPAIWQDDRYIVVDVNDKSVATLPLPLNSDLPSLSWLSASEIGITHQTQPKSGIGYSITDTTTMDTILIIEGAFTQIRVLGENLLAAFQDEETKTTQFKFLDFKGEVLQSATIKHLCRIVTVVDRKILLNCEEESLMMDADLSTRSFSDPILLLAPAPNGESILLVTRQGEGFLLNSPMDEQQSLSLTGNPIEICWLPDSSGFLYRTLGQLHYYSRETGESHLLFTSDLFGDYTNLNAVWIKTE